MHVPEATWRFLHLVAAAYWLGGLLLLAVVAVVAVRSLDQPAYRRLMARVGRSYLAGSLVAWLTLAVTGWIMARERVASAAALGSTAWGRTLELKTGLAVAAVILTLAHSWAGSRVSDLAIRASRILSPLILALTLGIFYLAARLAG
jgi:putative copper export protein